MVRVYLCTTVRKTGKDDGDTEKEKEIDRDRGGGAVEVGRQGRGDRERETGRGRQGPFVMPSTAGVLSRAAFTEGIPALYPDFMSSRARIGSAKLSLVGGGPTGGNCTCLCPDHVDWVTQIGGRRTPSRPSSMRPMSDTLRKRLPK